LGENLWSHQIFAFQHEYIFVFQVQHKTSLFKDISIKLNYLLLLLENNMQQKQILGQWPPAVEMEIHYRTIKTLQKVKGSR